MRISTDDSDSPLVEKVRFLPAGWESLSDSELLALFAELRATITTTPARRVAAAKAPADAAPKKSRAKGFIIFSETVEEVSNDVSNQDNDS